MNRDGCVLNCAFIDSPVPSILNLEQLNTGQCNTELNYRYTNTKIISTVNYRHVLIDGDCIHKKLIIAYSVHNIII